MEFIGRICETGQYAKVITEGERITAIEALPEPSYKSGEEVWISPGFVDLQVNGYGGYDYNRTSWTQGITGDEVPQKIFELMVKSGTAMWVPTIVTSSREGIIDSMAGMAKTLDADKRLSRAMPAFHLEGPYISGEEGLRGAHPPQYTRDPDWDEFQAIQEAAGGRIKILTLAPEREGALPFIEKATASGVTVSIGHTGATAEQIHDAVKAGARLSTHLGNGSQNMIQRHSNYFFAQLASDEMTACVITDNHHLPPDLVKIIARTKGEDRLVVVSDVVALGGQPAGIYDNGRHEVLPSGKVVLAGTPYLAGAGHLMDVCAANLLRWTEMGTRGLARTCATNPANVIGLPNTGKVEPGYDADLTIFRLENGQPKDGEALDVVTTVLKGETVYQA